MAWVAEAGNRVYDSTNASSVAVTFSRAVPVGHKLVLGVQSPSAAGAVTNWTAVDSKSNTWTQRSQANGTSANAQVAILTCTPTTALTTSDTVTVTSVGRSPALWVLAIQEYDDILSSAFDVEAHATGSSTSPAAGPTGTAAQNQELLVICVGWTTGTWTAPSGWTAGTSRATTSTVKSMNMAWKYVNASGTRSSGTSTLSPTSAWAMTLVALKQNLAGNRSYRPAGTSTWLPTITTRL